MSFSISRIIENCGALRDLVPVQNFKNVKNTHRGVLLLVKLQAKTQHSSMGVFHVF